MALKAERASRDLGSELQRPKPNDLLQTLARAGLGSRAVIYVILAVLAALIIDHGRPPSQASGSGALAEVAKQPTGPFLLGLLSAGLVCYGCWRLLQAIAGVEPSEGDRPSVMQRIAWFAIGAVYFLLFAEALAILEGSGGSGGPANHPQGAAATVLSWPGGPVFLGVAGAALAAGAVSLAIWGCVHDYRETLDERRAPTWVPMAGRVTGTVGNLTRAALLALVASYTFVAAVNDAPSREKSIDQSLEAVMHSPAGAWWIALVALGLVAFAAFSVIEALYRRV